MREDIGKYADEIEAGLKADREEKNNLSPVTGKAPEEPEENNNLPAISGKELEEKELQPVRELVPGLIVQGLTVLGAPPKYGKSWLMLELCLAAAGGTPFLGYPSKRTGCLYLALEDSQRRLKDRMKRLLRRAPAPEGFYIATASLTTDTGLLPQLERFLADHPGTGLVVVDTLQKIRGTTFGRDGSYAADYRELGVLKGFADKHALALVLVHHLRKMGDETDPFNRLAGTTAIAGAADAMIVLTRDKREANTTCLRATGRDIEELEIEIEFQKDRCRWVNLGNRTDLAAKRSMAEYEASPVVKTVRKLVEQSAAHEWTGTATQLMEAGAYITGRCLAPSAKALGKRLTELDQPLLEADGIVHMTASRGTGGKLHTFRYVTAVSLHEATDQQEIPF